MLGKIVFLRHGEPDTAEKLTPRGKREVERVAQILNRLLREADLSPVLFSSPFPRAKASALLLARSLGADGFRMTSLLSGISMEGGRKWWYFVNRVWGAFGGKRRPTDFIWEYVLEDPVCTERRFCRILALAIRCIAKHPGILVVGVTHFEIFNIALRRLFGDAPSLQYGEFLEIEVVRLAGDGVELKVRHERFHTKVFWNVRSRALPALGLR